MVSAKSIDVVASATSSMVMKSGEGEPKQFVLRGNAECEQLVRAIACLGVTSVRCFGRTRNGDNAKVFTARPDFGNDIDISPDCMGRATRMATSLSHLIWCAACEAVAPVSVEECDLLVDALMVVDAPSAPARIHADVTVIEADDPKLVEWEIQLL